MRVCVAWLCDVHAMLPLRSMVWAASLLFCAFPPNTARSARAFELRGYALLLGAFMRPDVNNNVYGTLFWTTTALSGLQELAVVYPDNDVWFFLSMWGNASFSFVLLLLVGPPSSQLVLADILWSTSAGLAYVVAFAAQTRRIKFTAAFWHALCFLRAGRSLRIWSH